MPRKRNNKPIVTKPAVITPSIFTPPIIEPNDTLIDRINRIKPLITKYSNQHACMDIGTKNISFDGNGAFRIIKELGSGGYNVVKSICEKTNCNSEKDYYIIRTVKSKTDVDKPYEKFPYCISDRYSTIFSNIVMNDIFPNFPLMVGSYLCKDDYKTYYPISIQEYANLGTIHDKIKSNNVDSIEIKQYLLQAMLTIYFMNYSVKISHNDFKPLNTLIKSIKEQNIAYKLPNGNYIAFENLDKLVLVADFDLSRGNDNNYDTRYITHTYFCYKINTLYEKNGIPNKDNKIILTNISTVLPEEQVDTNIEFFRKIYDKILNERNNFEREILTLFFNVDESPPFIIDFLNEFINEKHDFFECLNKYFNANIVSDVDESYKIYNLINTDIDYITFDTKHYYSCISNDVDYRYPMYGDDMFRRKFIKKYGLERFISEFVEFQNLNLPADTVMNKDFTKAMQDILYDWIYNVCLEMHHKNQSTIICNICHYILSNENIARNQAQLVGIICIFLYTSLSVKDMLYVCDDAYDANQFYDMLNKILTLLNTE